MLENYYNISLSAHYINRISQIMKNFSIFLLNIDNNFAFLCSKDIYFTYLYNRQPTVCLQHFSVAVRFF